MDLGWKRAHHLVIILIFLKHAVADEGWFSQNVQPQQNWPVHQHSSLRGIQSSVLEAPVTRSIPVEEVAPNTVPGKSLNASRSRFSLSHQYVKGGFSSSYEPMSHTQSAPIVLDGTSLLKLPGSSSLSAQNVDRQDSYSWSSQDGSGLQGVSAQLASTPVRGGSSSALSILSQSSSQSTPDSLSHLNFKPFDVSGLPTSDQSSSNMFTASSQDSSGLQLGEASSPLSTQSSSPSGSSRHLFTATYQGSSQSTSSQNAPAHLGAKGPVYSQAAPSGSSLSQLHPTASRSQSFQTSGAMALQSSSPSQGSKDPSKFSTLTSASSPGHFASTQGSGKYRGLFSVSQGTSSQCSPGSSGYTKLAASPLGVSQSTSGHGSYSQYTSSSQSRAGTQLAGSSHYVPVQTGSTSTDGSSLWLQGTSGQYTPLNAKVYSQAAPSGPSLSPSQSSQWQPSSRWSKGFQTSGTVASQSSFPSQGSKAPSRFSTSAVRPGQLSSTKKESGRYGGLFGLSQSASTRYSSGSPAYAKRGSSLEFSSQSTSEPSSSGLYASSSQSRAGTQLAGSSHCAPGQTGSTSTDGSSLRLQGTSGLYAPLNASVYSQAAPSGPSLSPSQSSQWQPSRWSKGFQTSGTVASQISFPSQGSKAPSKFSTLTSAASPGHFASTQEGSGKYSGLFSLSQGTSSQYSPGSSGYTKLAASPLGVSQSTRGHGSYRQYTSSSQSRAGTQLAGSSHYAPGQTGSTFTDGSSLHLQGTSTQYVPTALGAKVPVYRQSAPSRSLSLSQPSQWQPSSRWSQGFQTSGTVASRSSSPFQGSKDPSRFSTSAVRPGQLSSTKKESGRYGGLFGLSQSASTLYSSGSPVYAKRGSSLEFSSQSTSEPSSSGLYASSSQSMAGTQLAGSSSYVPAQTGSTFTGASFQFQGTSNHAPSVSSQYTQASPSESSLTGSEAFRKWQPSASPWSQWFQASGTVVPQSSSSPQSAQTSSVSFLPALSPSVDSVAQSSISSSRRNSVFGTGLGPSKLSAQAASGSAVSSQISPGLSASVHHPSGSLTSSLGSSVQGALQGTFSGQSSDSTSLISSSYGSTYGQKASGFSRPSQISSAAGRYSSSVKG